VWEGQLRSFPLPGSSPPPLLRPEGRVCPWGWGWNLALVQAHWQQQGRPLTGGVDTGGLFPQQSPCLEPAHLFKADLARLTTP